MEVVMSSDSIREERLVSWMNQYAEALLRMCSVYLRDSAMAEDAVQETFVKAYKAMDTFRGECSEKSWLMRIAINTCKDMRRSSWFRYVDHRITLEKIPQPAIEPSDDQADLAMVVMKLPHKYMEVILLYYYQGMTIREVSQALQMNNQTVSSRLKRAREKLHDMLEGGRQHG